MRQELLTKPALIGEANNEECLFKSDGYEIKFWEYDSLNEANAVSGYTEHFCVTYVHSGNLVFDLFNRHYDLRTGHILIDKPRYEFNLPPAAGTATVFRFYPAFYQQLLEDAGVKNNFFFGNPNLLSLALTSVPEADYLHYQIVRNKVNGEKMEMDGLVMDLLQCVVNVISNKRGNDMPEKGIKNYHSAAIEKAKEYMHRNFSRDISLKEIATYACISPFHFSRVFKQATSFSPHQYLLQVRLKHAQVLLKNTTLPIREVSASSGFRMPEYFSTSFKQKFLQKPGEYRMHARRTQTDYRND